MILFLGVLLSVQSPWDDPAPTGRWAASTAELASQLLPPDIAADAVSHVVTRGITQGGPPASVRFNGRPRETGDGFCVRKQYGVTIYAKRGSGEVEIGPHYDRPVIRLGECEGIFAYLNPGASAAEGKRVLRWMQWAQATARMSESLPFSLICTDETGQGKCAAGAAAVLASLPLENAFLVTQQSRSPHEWEVAVTETQPGQLLWDIRLDASPEHPSIGLTWKIPAPF